MLIAAALVASPAAAIGPPDPAASMYTPDSIVAIDLTLPQASLEALETEPPSDEYQEGTFSLATTDGTPEGTGEFSPPLTVGVRLKGGHGSFRPLSEKAAFKLKLNFIKGQKFLGLKKMTLNNMVQDPSMVHETLAYEAFRSFGVPASRTGYAYLRVNGLDYGLYLNLETLDDVSLPHLFGSTRHLYEADAPGTDVSPGSEKNFEVDEGDDEDLTDLEALIAAANDKVGDWSDGMAAVADLGEMAKMWAVERYIGHWDGYAGQAAPFRPNNYYLHSEDTGPAAGIFQMLPWGTDQTWETEVEFDEPAGGLLFNECLADSDCGALYVGALEGLQAPIASLELDRQARCLAEQLAPWQALEDVDRREYDAEEIAEGVATARDFIADRPQELAEWLGAEAPASVIDDQPCHPVPPDETPPTVAGPGPAATPNPGGPTPAPGATIRLRRIAIDGGALKARVRLPVAGRVKLAAWIGAEASGRLACAGRYEGRAAGVTSVRCRITEAALRRLESGRLRLTVKAFLVARSGERLAAVRTVDLPRR
jgi:hypothetical protein